MLRRLPSDHVLLAIAIGAIALVLFTLLTLHAVVSGAPDLGGAAGAPTAHLVDNAP